LLHSIAVMTSLHQKPFLVLLWALESMLATAGDLTEDNCTTLIWRTCHIDLFAAASKVAFVPEFEVGIVQIAAERLVAADTADTAAAVVAGRRDCFGSEVSAAVDIGSACSLAGIEFAVNSQRLTVNAAAGRPVAAFADDNRRQTVIVTGAVLAVETEVEEECQRDYSW
jgi:hypothetical protein